MNNQDKFYITTAINYMNGPPHIGHAYEAITADVFARYHRLNNEQVFFLTGSDEHGQKISDTAKKQNMTPIELCDKYVDTFKSLNQNLNVSNDFYIRTTSEQHKKFVLWFWNKALEKEDIYLGQYTGWYNVREETYVTNKMAELHNYKDIVSGNELIQRNEPSYFFKLNKYKDQIINHINDNPHFILPLERRNEILDKLIKEELNDISISRTNFDWGIKTPENNHVMYVWFDALTNYLSALNFDQNNNIFWPPNITLIGKDIIWFHAVIFSGMLMSCDIPLPNTILCHGFVNDSEGKKMSKSLGNTIDPVEIIEKYNHDIFRFYMFCDAGNIGEDIKFDINRLIDMNDNVLGNSLGNLILRTSSLMGKIFQNKIKDQDLENNKIDIIFNHTELVDQINNCFLNFQLCDALKIIMDRIGQVNKYFSDNTPWKNTYENNIRIMSSTMNAIYILVHFLYPYIPTSCDKILNALGAKLVTFGELVENNNITSMNDAGKLFDRINKNKYDKKKN